MIFSDELVWRLVSYRGVVIFLWVYRLITVQAEVAQGRPRSPGTGPQRQHWYA